MKELLTLKNFDNNYRKVLKVLINSLKDIGKWAQFYKAAVVQPTYLLKKDSFRGKI